MSAKPIIKKCSFQRFPLRERSGVKATRPSPNGQLLLRKTSFQFLSCHHFVIWPFHSCTSQCCLMIKLFCQSSLLSQICHRHDRCLVIPSRHTMQKVAIRPQTIFICSWCSVRSHQAALFTTWIKIFVTDSCSSPLIRWPKRVSNITWETVEVQSWVGWVGLGGYRLRAAALTVSSAIWRWT